MNVHHVGRLTEDALRVVVEAATDEAKRLGVKGYFTVAEFRVRPIHPMFVVAVGTDEFIFHSDGAAGIYSPAGVAACKILSAIGLGKDTGEQEEGVVLPNWVPEWLGGILGKFDETRGMGYGFSGGRGVEDRQICLVADTTLANYLRTGKV